MVKTQGFRTCRYHADLARQLNRRRFLCATGTIAATGIAAVSLPEVATAAANVPLISCASAREPTAVGYYGWPADSGSMRVAAIYSQNRGREEIGRCFPDLIVEVNRSIGSIRAEQHRSTARDEKTATGQGFFSPKSLKRAFRRSLARYGEWKRVRVQCDYPAHYYSEGYATRPAINRAYREIDFVKKGLGIEVQFGQQESNACGASATMAIFRNLGYLSCGIDIVPVESLAVEMPAGTPCFEQFAWDLEKRGVANLGPPMLVLGVDF
jgi:hypothetical protein